MACILPYVACRIVSWQELRDKLADREYSFLWRRATVRHVYHQGPSTKTMSVAGSLHSEILPWLGLCTLRLEPPSL